MAAKGRVDADAIGIRPCRRRTGGRDVSRWFKQLRGAPSATDRGRAQSATPWRSTPQVVKHFEAGRYAEAVEVARQLVALQRETLGERHPDYATAVSNLGLLVQKQGDLAAAEPLLRQASSCGVRCSVAGIRTSRPA